MAAAVAEFTEERANKEVFCLLDTSLPGPGTKPAKTGAAYGENRKKRYCPASSRGVGNPFEDVSDFGMQMD